MTDVVEGDELLDSSSRVAGSCDVDAVAQSDTHVPMRAAGIDPAEEPAGSGVGRFADWRC